MLNKFLMIAMMFAFLAVDAKSQEVIRCRDGETQVKSLCLKSTQRKLVDTDIDINIYTKRIKGKTIDRTFVVVHNNEQKGLNAVKEVISKDGYYGRLIEVVSNYKEGHQLNENDVAAKNQKRYLYFENGKSCIDPNRIYSEQALKKSNKDKEFICKEFSDDKVKPIYDFGQELLKIFINDLPDNLPDERLNNFIIGVHNNAKNESLNAGWWLGNGTDAKTGYGVIGTNYHENALSADDFILVSNLSLFHQFFDKENPFALNIAIQEEMSYLIGEKTKPNSTIDDGSMSIYFGTTKFGNTKKPYSYINVEGGGKEDTDDKKDASKIQQKKIIEKIIKQIVP